MRRVAAAAGVLTAVSTVASPMATPVASSQSLSGTSTPGSNANWAQASHGEVLGTNNINAGDVIAFWQGFLASYTAVACPSGIDGHFGSATASGTRSIQSFFGLTADGVVGPNTWKAAGGWLEWGMGSNGYESWTPFGSSHAQIHYAHATPNGAWKWQSTVTSDYPSYHASDYPGITFSNGGHCS